jgi:putative transposase
LAIARFTHRLRTLMPLICLLLTRRCDGMRFLLLCLGPRPALAAENLFLRKQLVLSQERHVKPRQATHMTRMALTWLARWCNWRQARVIVQPATLIRCHRQGFRLSCHWKATPGRPPIPADLQALICRIARENSSWGEERIANELSLKLGLRVSPRTVRKYLPARLDRGGHHRVLSQCWRTFMRNHAKGIIACDFCVVVTATFRLLYIFVVMEHATRRILHTSATAHPTAQWTWQQLREASPSDHAYGFLIHALGPGIPRPPSSRPGPLHAHRHRLPEHPRVVVHAILGGLHHEYQLVDKAA